ncbi:flagellar biosynthesis protein FlhF [Peribacillus kribbensis]|uniref:flagellar biosynthesis protein FlhF n=1 Tax=Peribacillus kribbensis TaxID=356658 RepID=UPI00041CBED9|nr:flagellar biosynthesis protein FlhF [Peribacillus kribbensis]
MKIKKYITPTMTQAMEQIKNELGNDAVILNSKVTHSGGFLGLFKKRNFEVLAAIDSKPQAASLVKSSVEEDRIIVENPFLQQDPPPVHAGSGTRAAAETGQGSPEAGADSGGPKEILAELESLKQMLKEMDSDQLEAGGNLPLPIRRMDGFLKDKGIGEGLRSRVAGRLMEKWYQGPKSAGMNEVFSWASTELEQAVSGEPFHKQSFTKKFINVVGPTGVGKTTTLAKMASDLMMRKNKKIAFITADTYRIGAIEQLKTYAQILGVPVEVAYNMEDFRRASQRFQDYDHILVDTAGRNYRSREFILSLQEVIDFHEDLETFLVLSLASKEKDMEEICMQFSSVPIDHFIFTKADETSSRGAILNLMMKYQLGTAFLTTGQNVPDDMVKAEPPEIIKQIIGEHWHE